MKYILIFIILVIPGTLIACDCNGAFDASKAYRSADHVFSGTLIKAELSEDYQSGKFSFNIKQSFKGNNRSVVIVNSAMHSCTLSMTLGRTYLLYLENGQGIFLCSGSKDSAYVEKEEWEFLKGER